MHRWRVIYSSVTGNTKKVAEEIAKVVGTRAEPVTEISGDVCDADIIAIGYWLWRGGPDPKTSEFLPKVCGANVVLFETHAAKNRSEHSVTAFARAACLLGENCRILATFECQGKVSEAVALRRAKLPADDPHARASGWHMSTGHPDEADMAAAREFAARADEKLTRLEDAAARRAAIG